MERSAGILLHISSLPSAYGIGDLGPEAHRFAERLEDAGMRWWQILPVTPTDPGLGNSPYSSYSAFAGNIDLISPESLAEEGFVSRAEMHKNAPPASERIHFEAVRNHRRHLLRTAYNHARPFLDSNEHFNSFCGDNAIWLNDFAMFMSLKNHFKGRAWTQWPAPLRDRHDEALRDLGTILADEILFRKFSQFLFFSQWGALKKTLKKHNVGMIGDAPIYVTHDSSDVWANRELFKLDAHGEPTCVAGVPPDYFSETGQRWGNPVFDWKVNRERGFGWWISRLRHTFGLVDLVRLDHFRGFAAYWEIDAQEETAINGRWVRAAGRDLFHMLREQIGEIPIIAEDLGVITGDVVEMREDFGFPGMKILQFAFLDGCGPDSGDLPYNHTPDTVVYTGTHDNNTTRGWYAGDLGKKGRAKLSAYSGKRITESTASSELIRLAMASPSRLAIIPLQDVMNLDETARMNRPSTVGGNWSWRPARLPSVSETAALLELAETYGRTGGGTPMYDTYPSPPVD